MKKLFTYLLTSIIAVTAAAGSMPVMPVVYAEEAEVPTFDETPVVPEPSGDKNPIPASDIQSSEDEGLPTADETESLEENEPCDESGFSTPGGTGTESEETADDEESEDTPDDPESPGDENPMVTPDTPSSRDDITVSDQDIQPSIGFTDQEFERACNGVGVSVSGLLPEGVTVSVSEVSSEEIQDRVNEDGLELTILRSFDISLFLDGEEYEPSDDGNSLIVRFTNLGSDIENTEAVTVIHTTDEGETTVVGEIVEVSEDAVAFAAADFSVYSIGVMTVEGSYTVPIVGRDGDIYHMYLSHDGEAAEAFCLDIGKSAHNGDTYNLVGRYTENREVRNVVQCYRALNEQGNPYAPTYAEAQVLVWAAVEGHMTEAEIYEVLGGVTDSGHSDEERTALAGLLGTDSIMYQSYYLLGNTYLWTNAMGSETDGYQRFVSTVGADAGSAEFTVRFVDYDDSEISTHTYNSGDAVVTPSDPVRDGFTFTGWSPAVEPICTADATYKATYTVDTEDRIRYVIHFVREDGSLAGYFSGTMDDLSFEEGDGTVLPESGFSTTLVNAWFLGWKPVLSSGNFIYPVGTSADVLIENGYMTGTETLKECTLRATYVTSGHNKGTLVNYWDMDYKDINGGKGELIESLFFQNTAKIAPPHKYRKTESEATAKFYTDIERTNEYTFGELDPAASNPAHEIDLYKEDTAKFRVVFRNYNNAVISANTYKRGETIIIPADPTRPASNHRTYRFSGWTPEVSAVCTGDATYVATYEEIPDEYTVVFINESETLSSKTYFYGDMIEIPADPHKAGNEYCNYVFKGWTPEVSAVCTRNATYEATYDVTPVEYTVVFRSEGKILSSKTYRYGAAIEIPADPYKAGDSYCTYTFSGWNPSVSDLCRGNATYDAVFSSHVVRYLVRFVDEGRVISEHRYSYGDVIDIPGDPVKQGDVQHTYTFNGWTPIVSRRCIGDAAYVSTYTTGDRHYSVQFLDSDNITQLGSLKSDYTYDSDIVNEPDIPQKADDSTYIYYFSGWTSSSDGQVYAYGQLPHVTEDVIYTAHYLPVYRTYTVRFVVEGEVIDVKGYHYGDEISVPADPEKDEDKTYTYSFEGWDPAVKPICDGDAVYKAIFSSEKKPKPPVKPNPPEEDPEDPSNSTDDPEPPGDENPDVPSEDPSTPKPPGGEDPVTPSPADEPTPKDPKPPVAPTPPGNENPGEPSETPSGSDPKTPAEPDPSGDENPMLTPDMPLSTDSGICDESGFSTPGDTDTESEKTSKKVPLIPIIGGVVVTAIVGGVLVLTGGIDYLWTAFLWLLFKKRRIRFHGVLTDEKNPFIKISAHDNDTCDLCSDYLEKSGNLTEYIEYVKGCGAVTTMPYKTQMSLSYLDGSEVVTNEYDADEEKLFELLDEMDAMNVDVHIFNNRAHFDIPLTFDFTKK